LRSSKVADDDDEENISASVVKKANDLARAKKNAESDLEEA